MASSRMSPYVVSCYESLNPKVSSIDICVDFPIGALTDDQGRTLVFAIPARDHYGKLAFCQDLCMWDFLQMLIVVGNETKLHWQESLGQNVVGQDNEAEV